ncbi:hypothetical protein I551_1113 [Mycobacterium ulcerans str. Harvey]|uniref:Uncharacterized protein n=1 Tax=Mycobacterium ulcerans str. Harvey TaxID=1299332 RepID=A0ABP3AMS0_MYCUL|nr:hypothetical protein I551_1113 [Mycobacterium ulcerans str. Harvey]
MDNQPLAQRMAIMSRGYRAVDPLIPDTVTHRPSVQPSDPRPAFAVPKLRLRCPW